MLEYQQELELQSELKVSYDLHVLSRPVKGSGDSYRFLMQIWDRSLIGLQEQVYVLFLNNCNEVISWRRLNIGTSDECLFDIKFALALALNCMASKMIIAHNHPSGMLKPSASDIAITKKLIAAASFMDIKVLDHIIIAPRDFYSFLDTNLMIRC